jgi:hypothetical protein
MRHLFETNFRGVVYGSWESVGHLKHCTNEQTSFTPAHPQAHPPCSRAADCGG